MHSATTLKAITCSILALASASVCVLPAATAPAATVEISDGDATSAVTVADVARKGESVVGTIVNRGADEIRDIRLLIDMPFLWANEVKPGEESPGRSSVLTVAGPLAPGGRLAFEFTPNPPLPERADGHFADPQAHVLGYQSISSR